MSSSKTARLYYYGLSLVEIEVLYNILSGSFNILEEEKQLDDPEYVSMVKIEFPLPYNESFFQLFTVERWFKIKGIIKEIRRRRGRKGLKAFLCFCGISSEIKSHLIFSLMNKNDRQFEVGVEKIEYLVDVIPLQLGTLPTNTEEVIYSYDIASLKWRPHVAKSGGLDYFFKDNEWKK